MTRALKAGTALIPLEEVEALDLTWIKEDYVVISTKSGRHYQATGFDAVEAVMWFKPSAVEGVRLSWRKWDWALHNLVAHPAMQILAFVGLGRLAVRLHDATTPRPR
jgi:hypothetical protein